MGGSTAFPQDPAPAARLGDLRELDGEHPLLDVEHLLTNYMSGLVEII